MNTRMSKNIFTAILVLFLLAIILNVFLWLPAWGGDPEIHIIFAKNFLEGGFLQFNLGEATSGETSVIYMLLVALLIKMFGVSVSVILMKLIGFLSLGSIVIDIFSYLKRKAISWRLSVVIAMSILVFPFTIFQASLGMENMLFAAIAIKILRIVLEDRFQWYNPVAWVLMSAVLIFLFFLRPEAVFVIGMLVTIALIKKDRVGLIALGGGIIFIGIIYFVIVKVVGAPLHGAGEIRAVMGRLDSFVFEFIGHQFYINKKPFHILIYLWPYALFVILAIPAAANKRWKYEKTIIPIFWLVIMPIGMHLYNILPSTHFSRYSLYIVFSAIIITAPVVGKQKNVVAAFIVIAIASLSAMAIENYLRLKRNVIPSYFSTITQVKQLRKQEIKEYSDRLCLELGCKKNRQTVLALQEVQLRGRLDGRFLVWSMDGITDYRLSNYVRDWGVDHLGYLSERKVDYLLDFPNYSITSEKRNLMKIDIKVLGKYKFNKFTAEVVKSDIFGRNIVKFIYNKTEL